MAPLLSDRDDQPHFVRRREPERFVQHAAIDAGVQDHRINLIYRAPLQRDLHQGASHTAAAVLGFGIDVENVAAPLAGCDHVGWPIHQPEAQACSDRGVGREGEPGTVLACFHLSAEPRSESRAHGIKSTLVTIAHLLKHSSPMMDDCVDVKFFERSGAGGHFFDDSGMTKGIMLPLKHLRVNCRYRRTLICMTPASSPGAPPAYRGFIVRPPQSLSLLEESAVVPATVAGAPYSEYRNGAENTKGPEIRAFSVEA